MLLRLLPSILLLAFSLAEEPAGDLKAADKSKEELKTQVYIVTPLDLTKSGQDGRVSQEIRQFPVGQQYSPEIYGLTYVQPQGAQDSLLRLQPQIVLYGPGGQGQPILINPGNPPGNFLIPQGPGPNVVLRNNPQGIFPQVAGFPKSAHVPPIEKDAEEIPTNPAKVPPLQTGILIQPKSNNKPQKSSKPEKLETFTESTEQNTRIAQGPIHQFNPETVSLRPGQRFFVLNGNNLFNYPYEEQQELPGALPAVRYTNVQQPQHVIPQQFLQPFAQEPPQYLDGHSPSVTVPELLLRNSFINTNQPGAIRQQDLPTQTNAETSKSGEPLRTAFEYSRKGFAPNHLSFPPKPQFYYVEPQKSIGAGSSAFDQPGLGIRTSNDGFNQIGQFRFTPNPSSDLYNFRDDFENDAVVVDASFDASTNSDQREGSLKTEETVSSTTEAESRKNETEPAMAQAGPLATAIAGTGGVAGSAPRATAIVGKGGLAVSSPQATAVAGTKDDEKEKEKSPKATK